MPLAMLTIAGSDSGGGAGVAADTRTFAAFGLFATQVVTAVTSQNTRGVQAVSVVPAEHLRSQLNSVLGDFDVAAIKVGLLPDAASVRTIADVLRSDRFALLPCVVDPVLVSTSGHSLARNDVVAALRESLLPRATVLTPNLAEAAALLGWEAAAVGASRGSMKAAALALCDLGPSFVLLKGGHLGDDCDAVDVLAKRGGEGEAWALEGVRILDAAATHGTGCTLSAAIACRLALGDTPEGACGAAKAFVARVIRASSSLRIGAGPQHPMDTACRWGGGATPRAGVTPLDVSVYAITPDGAAQALGEDGLCSAIDAAIRGGATAVQLREKSLPCGAYVALAARVLALCRASNVALIINDRADVAIASSADGVHVGPDDMGVDAVRRLVGPTMWIGASAKTPEAARAAVAAGADYLGSGACFASSSKDSSVIGLGGLRAVVEAVGPHTKVVAIGGISAGGRARDAIASGAAGVAVISAVFGGGDVPAAARAVADEVAGARAGRGDAGDGACIRVYKL